MPRIIRHMVIPDTQVKPGVPTDHLLWAGKYIAHKKPDVIVIIGDWWDYPSLSSWDKGKRSAENRRVSFDHQAGVEALDLLEKPWRKLRGYKPRKVFTMGNHENRAYRYMEDNPSIDTIPDPAVALKERGWEVHEFLKPVSIHGVHYCHFFCRNAQGKVTGSRNGQPSAKAQADREAVTTVAGHKQGLEVHTKESIAGRIRAIIAGSFYLHSEDYLTPQGNDHWHGCLLLNDVRNGDFELCEVSLRHLKRMYGGKK